MSFVVWNFDSKNAQYLKFKGKKKDHSVCAHCGLVEHTKDKCFKLHEYPPNYKKARKATSNVHIVSNVVTLQSGDSSM